MSRLLTFVRVDGDLVRVSVNGAGRPLLLIMGLGGNIEMWAPLERALNARGVQTIAYDASGMGDSPPARIPMRMPRLARQAARMDAKRASSSGACDMVSRVRVRHSTTFIYADVVHESGFAETMTRQARLLGSERLFLQPRRARLERLHLGGRGLIETDLHT